MLMAENQRTNLSGTRSGATREAQNAFAIVGLK
jgi:hypothetical protein